MKKNAKALLALVMAVSIAISLSLPSLGKLTVKTEKPGLLIFNCDPHDLVFLTMQDSEQLAWDMKMRGKGKSFILSLKNKESQISFELTAGWDIEEQSGGQLNFILGEKSGSISWYRVCGVWDCWWGFAVTI